MPDHRRPHPLPRLLMHLAAAALIPLGCAPAAAGPEPAAPAITAAPAAAAPSAHPEVLEAVETIFRGMRTADSTLIRSVLAEGVRFAMLTEAGDAVRYAPVDGWLRAVADSEGRWDERIYDVEILVDEPIATAWTPYTFYLDGRVLHCGVNAIALLRTAAGWKVTQLSDSRRQEDCPDPLATSNGG